MTRVNLSFTGSNGKGSVSVSGLKIGDLVTSVVALASSGTADVGTDLTSYFSKFIFVAEHIQQVSASDLSSTSLMIILDRQVIIDA